MTTKNMIVVGVDGSDGGRRALQWALTEAVHTGDTVHAVTAWHWTGAEALAPATPSADEEHRAATNMLASEIADGLLDTADPVTITSEVSQGQPGRVLTQAAHAARLLVIGSHGHSRLFHSVLGSVSQECIRHAACPVLVVPTPRTEPDH
jgi:nucleotide-binding universal stress UspA family protein